MAETEERRALAELVASLEELERCPLCSLDADEHSGHDERLRRARKRAKDALAHSPN